MFIVFSKFQHGIHHRQDVLRRDIIHDGVNGGQHVAAAGSHDVDHPLDLIAHLLLGAHRQDVVRIHCAAESKLISIAGFYLRQVGHFSSRGLDRVEDIHTDLNEIRDQVEHIAIGMEEYFGFGALFDKGDVVGVDGF